MDRDMITPLITSLMEARLRTLEEARDSDTKVVGYLPGGYVPDELIYASGAIPLCLSHGGDARPAEQALSLVPNVICPFARAQIGEILLRTNPFYKKLDLVVVPCTCEHLKQVGDVWEYYDKADVFKLGVPYDSKDDYEIDYFRGRLSELKKRLERLAGNIITDEKLTEAIAVYNRLRGLLKSLSLTRRGPGPGISTLDFVRLNHVSMYADPVMMCDALEAVISGFPACEPPQGKRPSGLLKGDVSPLECDGYAQDKNAKSANSSAIHATEDAVLRRPVRSGGRDFVFQQPPGGPPRVMIMGPALAFGDHDILKMAASVGADVVVEEIFEGIRDYWHVVDGAGDPIDVLARSYLRDKRPAAFVRGATQKRVDFALDLIRGFDVQGVLWYQLLCCELYDEESYLFDKVLRERGIPMLVVESDYHNLDVGSVRTRLEAFVEIIEGGLADA